MPYEPEKVQVYKRVSGAEMLVGTNFYKRFERRVSDDHETEVCIAQGGAWFSVGGEPIALSDVPEWVWAECRAMDEGFRRFYRIVLPEERKAGTIIPSADIAPAWPTDADVLTALTQLDPTNDADWTEDGRPNLLAVRRVLGIHVPRNRLNAIAPTFVRPTVDEDASA